MLYDGTYNGRVYGMVNGEVYTYNSYGKLVYAGVHTGGTLYVKLTGYYLTGSDGKGYQTTGGGYVWLEDGWQEVRQDSRMQYSQSQAQLLVKSIIANNKHILCNNLLCARFAYKLTSAQKEQVRALQSRLQARDKALQANGLCSDIQFNYPSGYAYLQPYLESLQNGEDVSGVGSITTTIVVTAIVVAAMSTAAYFAYKAYAAESEQDVKYSDELTKILTSKLTEEEYQQLLNETKGIVTKARIKASLGSYYTIVKYGLIAALAVWGLGKVKTLTNN